MAQLLTKQDKSSSSEGASASDIARERVREERRRIKSGRWGEQYLKGRSAGDDVSRGSDVRWQRNASSAEPSRGSYVPSAPAPTNKSPMHKSQLKNMFTEDETASSDAGRLSSSEMVTMKNSAEHSRGAPLGIPQQDDDGASGKPQEDNKARVRAPSG